MSASEFFFQHGPTAACKNPLLAELPNSALSPLIAKNLVRIVDLLEG